MLFPPTANGPSPAPSTPQSSIHGGDSKVRRCTCCRHLRLRMRLCSGRLRSTYTIPLLQNCSGLCQCGHGWWERLNAGTTGCCGGAVGDGVWKSWLTRCVIAETNTTTRKRGGCMMSRQQRRRLPEGRSGVKGGESGIVMVVEGPALSKRM